ncbi:MAG: GWxTD domain-containing protein [candidate division WOR-3 bacterium]
MTFSRIPEGFEARLRVSVQVMDKGRNVVAGDEWQQTVRASDFAVTGTSDSVVAGLVELGLPSDGARAQLEVLDVGSERRCSATFAVVSPSGQLPLRVLRSGRLNPGRTFGIGDTIEFLAELPDSGPSPESVQFTAGRGGRVVLGSAAGVVESSGGRQARFLYPVADAEGSARLGHGEYWVEAKGLLSGAEMLTGRTSFRVSLPFFYDDSAYRVKVDQLVYIATPEEIRRLRSTSRSERERAWADFWRPRDSNPGTARNETEEEYFERVEFAETNFRAGDNGYRSDRGSVYVRYGPPDQIEARPFDIDRPAEQTWSYYASGMSFRFVDRFGSGMFLLVQPGDFNGW